MLLTVTEIAYLGPVPMSDSVQHGASQKSIPGSKHNRNRQRKLYKASSCTKNYRPQTHVQHCTY